MLSLIYCWVVSRGRPRRNLFGTRGCWASGHIRTASVLTDILLYLPQTDCIYRARAAVGECLHRFIILVVDRALLEMALHLSAPISRMMFKLPVRKRPVCTSFMRNVADFAHGYSRVDSSGCSCAVVTVMLAIALR